MLGSIVKRSQTNYAVKIYVGGGKSKWHSGFRTKAEAERFRASYAVNVLQAAGPGFPGSGGERVASYLKEWLEKKRRDLRPRVWERYEQHVRVHIVPSLGWVKLSRLGPPAINKWLRDLQDKGLSPQTVRNALMCLNRAMVEAVREGRIARNPCARDMIERPRVRPTRPTVWTPEQARAFLAESGHSSRFHALYLLKVTSGLRLGEVLGLRRDDVDPARGVVMVTQALQRVKGGGYMFVPPKSESSRRAVAIPPDVARELKAHLRAQAESRLRAGPAYKDTGLVFQGPTGQPLQAKAVRKDFHTVARRAKVPEIRLHDLRHSHGSWLAQANVPTKLIQERLGHSSAAFTMNTYVHAVPGTEDVAAQAVAKVLAQGRS